MPSTKLAYQQCPSCFEVVDGATQVASRPGEAPSRPRPGDYTICVYCSALLQFDDNIRVRRVPAAERATLFAQDPKLRTIHQTIAEAVIRGTLTRAPRGRSQ